MLFLTRPKYRTGAAAQASEQALRRRLEKVSGAAQAPVESGAWQALPARYEALPDAQSADLRRLNGDKNRLPAVKEEKEIRKKKCAPEEYQSLVYSEALEQEAKVGLLQAVAAHARKVEDSLDKMAALYGAGSADIAPAIAGVRGS